MAFDPDEYLRGSAPTPSATVEPAPPGAELAETKAAPVSGFDPDAYLKSVGISAPSATPAAPGSAPTAFDPDVYLAKASQVVPAPKESGMLAEATNYIKDQADILGADLRIGAINTGIAVDNLKLAGLMELQESRKAKYGDNLDAMPPDVRKDHIATGKVIEKTLAQVAESSMKIKDIEKTTGVRGTTKAFKDIMQAPEYKEAPFMTKAQMVGEKFIQDPVGIVTDLGLQSLPQSLGIAATALMARVGLLSPTAAATAGGATSAMMEFGNQYSALRQEGMDHKEAWEKAGIKSGVIGMFDAVSFKMAGTAAEDVMKNISKGAFKETAKVVGKGTAKQAGLGGAGEAVSSVAIGQPIDPGEVLSEAAGEIFGAPGEAIATYRTERARGITPELRAPEPPEARVIPTPNVPTAAAPAAAPTATSPATAIEPAMMADLAAVSTEPIEPMPVAKAATTTPSIPATTQAAQTFENIERPQVKTPQFQQWFGGSKVKDEAGAPKVMYHGAVNFEGNEFKPKAKVNRTGNIDGYYFTTDPTEASKYSSKGEDVDVVEGAEVIPAYLSLQNPFVKGSAVTPEMLRVFEEEIIKNNPQLGDRAAEYARGKAEIMKEYGETGRKYAPEIFPNINFPTDAKQRVLKAGGYDGFQDGGNHWVAFDSNQIKSAIGNQGTFSPTSADITENIERQYILPSAFSQQLERSPSLRTELKRLDKMFKSGRISSDIFAKQAAVLLEDTKKTKETKPRLRGQNIILEKLNAAARKGELSQESVDLASWFIGKNPNLVQDLALSVRQPGEGTPSGRYTPINQLVTLFKQSGSSETAVHEILHHSERMMPENVQNGIRKLWLKRLTKAAEAANKGSDKSLQDYFENVLKYHMDNDTTAANAAKKAIVDGSVDYSNYQYINPSEFWAVNATEIVAGRFEGSKSFLGKLKEWLKDFAAKAKSFFGLDSNAPIIRALDSLSKADGKFQSDSMLGEGRQFESIEPKKVKIERKNYKGDPAPLATWAQKPDGKYISDTFIYRLQDPLIDVKRMVQAINSQVGEIDTKWDPYKREILYHGRASDAVKKFLRYDVKALVEKASAMGLTMPEVKEYLHNRHAPERNAYVAKINPSMPDGGSGIDTDVAEKYLKDLPADKRKKFEEIAKKVDEIIKKTQQVLVDTGQEPKELIDSWNKAFKHYVPLFRDELDYVDTGAKGTGQGFSVRGGFSKRAMGSDKPIEDILTNIISAYERAVGRGEKNLVLQSLYGLAIQNPNPDIYLPINPDAVKSTKAAKLELAKMGISPTDVENILREPMESYIDPQTGLVGQRLKQSIRDSNYALPLRIEGKQRFLIFNPTNEQSQRAALALKNMDTRDLHAAFGFFSKFTRWFAAVNTQYNPFFGLVNFYRDVQGSAINLSTTPLAGKQREVMAGAVKNLKPVYQALRAETKGEAITTPVGRQFAEMQAYGGQTGYRDSYQQKKEQHKIIEDTLAKMEAGPIKQTMFGTLELLSDLNDAMENATRLSVYQAAIKNGLNKDDAAILAKTISVNFNKRGAWVQEANALYAFFNSAVQGTARTLETLRGPAGKKIIVGGLSIGVIQALALAMAGFDDEQPPPFVRDKNLIIPIPGTDKKYISSPMPLGLNVLPNIGRILTEIMLGGGKNADKKLGHLLLATLDSFNPFGSSESFAQLISPTFADPIIALAENKDAFGRPIYKKDRDTSPSPGYTRAKDTASTFSKELSRFLNFLSGGNEDRKGAFSPTPDQIDYVIGQVTGGVGRELMKIDQSLRSLGSGEELPPYKIPVVGRFYGDAASQAAQSGTFYSNVTKLSQFEREIKGRIARKEGTESIYRENPEARLWKKANRIENEISDLNKKKRDLIAKDAPAAQIKRIEEMKRNKMAAFNKEYEQATK
jgi:hypothetical protein